MSKSGTSSNLSLLRTMTQIPGAAAVAAPRLTRTMTVATTVAPIAEDATTQIPGAADDVTVALEKSLLLTAAVADGADGSLASHAVAAALAPGAQQFMHEMAETYATHDIVRSDMEKALNENAFLDFNAYVERHPGYKVLLIIGSTSQYGPSSDHLLRANIKTYVALHEGRLSSSPAVTRRRTEGRPGQTS